MGSRSPWEGSIFEERDTHFTARNMENSAVTCKKTAEPIVMPFGLWARTGPRSHELDGSRSPMRRGNYGEKGRLLQSIETFCRELYKTAKPIDLPFGLYTWVGQRKHKFNRICQVAPMCTSSIVFARWHQCA